MRVMARSRSLVGCWTCRLRRKKCDEGRPVCVNCSALEIECFFDDAKPEWMDGGKKQRERAEWLKLEVKRLASSRRERRFMRGLENLGEERTETAGGEDEVMVDVDEDANQTRPFSADSSVFGHGSGSGGRSATTGTAATATTAATSPLLFDTGGGASFIWPQLEENDMGFMMLYLDFVFPFLFPFYRPPFLHAGRGWLLTLLMRNKSLLHGALGVASHFWTVITCSPAAQTGTGDPLVIHQSCQRRTCEEMQKQQELLLQELQRDMQGILLRGGIKDHPVESSRVLASIVQMLTFEVAVANAGNWQMHLDAAVEVFGSLMGHCMFLPDGLRDDEEQDDDPYSRVLVQLGRPPSVHTVHNRPWSSDQAAFRFFTACLLFYDTLASTSLDRPPKLQKFHSKLLLPISAGAGEEGEQRYPTPHINLAEFLGVQNWVIISMGKISALSSWKKSQLAKGQLSITQLVSRANEIETCLRQKMADLNLFLPTSSTPSSSGQATSPSPGPMTPSTPSTNTSNSAHGIPLPCPTNNPINPNPLALDPLSIYLDPSIQNQHSATLGNMMGLGDLNFYKTHDPTSTGTTYVFAQGTLTYLYLVANGYQPLAPEIRGSVALTLSMLKALPTRTCVRTVIWPFTITGCLALEEEQDSFGDFVERMGRVGELGSVKKALGVMRGVWDWRKEHGGNMKKEFDLGEMFSGGLGGETGTEKGKPVLLV
ncbi:fungal-specific transcription factor domain-containing protein [Rhypophila decipiens]|uniref:Fungal-specific transcription factor domain-containing protein n=1 Tax=Rhypophila decipiens TaxID=261697 RepID=A0AAN6XUA0_9PEZI|nr:fungal-specific transcription factor domain-containing protein [Rhypophila decipiens]